MMEDRFPPLLVAMWVFSGIFALFGAGVMVGAINESAGKLSSTFWNGVGAMVSFSAIFWLLFIYFRLRSRSRPAPGVGSDRGGPDDDGEIAEPKSSVGHELSPPRRDRPIPFPVTIGEACNPMLAVRRRKR